MAGSSFILLVDSKCNYFSKTAILLTAKQHECHPQNLIYFAKLTKKEQDTLFTHTTVICMVILVLVSKNSSSVLQEWQCFRSHAQTHSHVR